MGEVSRIGYMPEDKRWKATIKYRVNETEIRTVIHHIEELEELQNLVEQGPTFCSIEEFKIEYCWEKETIEESFNPPSRA